MDYHSLTRKELQNLCKMNKIRANMTNFAMADALSFLPKVRGVEGNGYSTPKTPLVTSRKRKPTATKPLFELIRGTSSSSGGLAIHTRSPLTENNKDLYHSDIVTPKATRTCQEKAAGSLVLETVEDSNGKHQDVYVVNHPHGTRLAKRLKQQSQIKIAESAQKVDGRFDAINIEMLPGEETGEAVRTKYEVTDDVLLINEGNKVNVSNAEQDDDAVSIKSSKLVKFSDLEEFTVHLNGDQDATIEETSTTSIMGGVSRRVLNGCSSEVSFAPMLSTEKSWNTTRTLVRCTSKISSAHMVSAEKSTKVAHVKETASMRDPDKDQNMENEDQSIDNNGDQDVTIKETSTTSIMGGVSGDKISSVPSGSSSEVSFNPMVSSEKSWNTARTLVRCTSKISSAPMVPAEKSMEVALVLNESPLMGKEIASTKDPYKDRNMESKDQCIDEPSLIMEKAEKSEASHVDEEKSKLTYEMAPCDVTEDESENEEDGFNVNVDIPDAVEKFLLSSSISGPMANQIRVHARTLTRTATSENQVHETTSLISSTKKKAFATPTISAAEKSMNITGTLVGCTSEVFSASMKSGEKSMHTALARNESSLTGEETENAKHPNDDQNIEPVNQPIEINEVVECNVAHDLEVKFSDTDEPSLTAEKAQNLEDSNVEDQTSKLTCEVGFCSVNVTEVEENNTEDASFVNDDISDAVEKFSFTPSVTDSTAIQVPVHAATPTRKTASGNRVQETTPLISSTLKKVATTPKGSIKVLDEKKDITERGNHGVSSKVATVVVAEQKQNKGENTSQGKLRSTSVRQLKRTIKQLTSSESKNSVEVNNQIKDLCAGETDDCIPESKIGSESRDGSLNLGSKSKVGCPEKENNISKPKSSSNSKEDSPKLGKKPKNWSAGETKESITESHNNKGENTLQRKLKATSLRQLKKTIKQLTQSDKKNTVVKLNRDVVPEDNENEDENTALRELKATSARKLKKMIKQRSQTTRTLSR